MSAVGVLFTLAPAVLLLLALAAGRYPGEARLERARRSLRPHPTPRRAATRVQIPGPPVHCVLRPLLLAARCAGRAPPRARGTHAHYPFPS